MLKQILGSCKNLYCFFDVPFTNYMLQHALASRFRDQFLIFGSAALGEGWAIGYIEYQRRREKAKSQKNLKALQTPCEMQLTTITLAK